MAELLPRILIVEDEEDTRANLLDILELFGYEPAAVSSGEEALNHPDLPVMDVLILDRKLPDLLAEELLPSLMQRAPDTDVIIATAYADLDSTVAALRHGVADYLLKPVNPNSLKLSVERIIERRELELARQRSEAAFRDLVESTGSLILILRPDHSIAYVNPIGERLAGAGADEILGQDCFQQYMSHDLEAQRRYEPVFNRVLEGEPVSDFEMSVACSENHHHWLLCNARRLDDYEGARAVLVVGQDVTERRRAEQRLLQAERLAAIGKAMAGLAHESRNALQRSQASLDMLAAELEGNEFAAKLIGRIQTAQDDLHRLYEDVREYARPVQIQPRSENIDTLLHRAWEELSVKHEGREARLTIDSDTADTTCEVEPFLLRQVFHNILDNSLAACDDPVQLKAILGDTKLHGRSALLIRIEDNGPGLPRESRDHVFDEFFTTKTHGTGLGLAIVKRFIDAHGGTIRVDHDCSDGFAIQITIPRSQDLAD